MDKMIADRYMIVTSLGEGGMADVYLAMDTILNREVAVKVLRGELSEDPVALLRFLREASAVSKLHHPNVVEVYDVGEYQNKNYIVMEYIRGRTLKQLIAQRGALQKEEAVEIMKQLVSAVAHAHENNIIHRDIKPQNVLVKDDGTIKITDFGIALAHDAIQLTQSDAVLGSAHYIAPETTKGETATVQIDIYALGIVFYELLSGSVPFKGDNPIQIAMKHLREDIPSIREFNPTLPQSIENIIIKATAKNRACRYANAKDMLYDLDMCLLPEFANVDKISLDSNEKGTDTVVLNSVGDLNADDKTVESTRYDHERKGQSEKVSTKKMDPKKRMIIIVSAVLIALSAVIGGVVLVLNNNDDNQEVELYSRVPDLSGMTLEEAEKALEKKKLKLNKEVKEESTKDVEKGKIIDQSIKKDKKVEQGSKITVTVSSGIYFEVGNYVGWQLNDAKAALDSRIAVQVEEKESEDIPAGQIISQSQLNAGDKVEPDEEAVIKFVVAKEPQEKPEMFVVEDYSGLDYGTIKALLEREGITVYGQAVNEVNLPTPPKAGQILGQNIAVGTEFDLSKNNTITLTYYEPKEVDETPEEPDKPVDGE